MPDLVRSIKISKVLSPEVHNLLRDEWLVTNGLGGYASGTICGYVTRRYHGLLVAAMPPPLGRVVMLNHLAEGLRLPDGRTVQIGGEEPEASGTSSVHYVREFRLENQLPVWRFECDGIVLEKRVFMVHGQNTAYATFQMGSDHANVLLQLRPSLHFRSHDHAVSEALQKEFRFCICGSRYEVSAEGPWPVLRLAIRGGECSLTQDPEPHREFYYLREAERGYESRGQLWTPGTFSIELRKGQTCCLIASTEPWEKILALTPQQAMAAEQMRRRRLVAKAVPAARQGLPAELVLAADQFIVTPVGRTAESIRSRASGDQICAVIAGYHWFTDWGRDAMISLEGLTLATGRHEESGWILRTSAGYARNGLIPNLIPEESAEGLYHTADATLWFFHALDRYLRATDDRLTLQTVMPTLLQIIEHHRNGTRFGIHVDPRDGLLCQGQDGYQLTWMDAKAGDWVVTPRRGKAVEINALWYNALRLLEGWLNQEDDPANAETVAACARRAYQSFNQRFWYAEGGYLYDVIDGEQGDDTAFRPNQLFAISLDHPVLERQFWDPVIEKVRERLLTPVGLRSLSCDHPDYKPKYFGDLRSRDAAYHQGTVWAWLMGPYIDALLAAHPEKKDQALELLRGMSEHLNGACIGSISEVFDAEAPFLPRGCIAQAWSVAEALRCWVKVLS